VVPGYPDRILPRPGFEGELKKRTLTNLYNARPAWLANAHRALDAAVAAAYGWPADLDDADLLARLLALNLSRAGKG
jgi:type II restriction/modification system DNA methylase subunit YeeA